MTTNIKFFILAILTLNLTFSACKKDEGDNPDQQAVMTEEEAVETAEVMVATTATGLEDAAKVAEDYSEVAAAAPLTYCGTTFDTTWSESLTTQTGAGTYTATWGFKVNCQNLVPVSMDLTSDAVGTYESILLSGAETGEGDYFMDGFSISDENYEVNGKYVLASAVESKKGLKNTYSVEATFTLTDVLIDHSSVTIQSGSGVLTLIATSSTGKSATFTGTIVFNGDGTATMTVNGKSYTIDY